MITALKEREIKFVILDVLNVLHSADENDQTEMRKILDCAELIHRDTGSSVCICHHFSKEKGGRLTHRMRGSSAIAGMAEFIVGLEFASQVEGETIRVMEFELKITTPQ